MDRQKSSMIGLWHDRPLECLGQEGITATPLFACRFSQRSPERGNLMKTPGFPMVIIAHVPNEGK